MLTSTLVFSRFCAELELSAGDWTGAGFRTAVDSVVVLASRALLGLVLYLISRELVGFSGFSGHSGFSGFNGFGGFRGRSGFSGCSVFGFDIEDTVRFVVSSLIWQA